MAITHAKETRVSGAIRQSESRRISREWTLWYAADLAEAEAYLFSDLPLVHDGLPLSNYDLTPHEKDQRVITATLEYSTAPKKPRSEIGDEEISFDLSAQTVKRKQSLSTVASYGTNPPNFNGGIGYADGKFEGADVMVEAFSFTITKIYALGAITNTYIQSLRDTAFTWNSAAFRGCAIGECLFVGAAGSQRDAGSFSVAHKFLASRNVAGLSLGGISGISKQGWDYLWTLYETLEDDTAKFLTPRPRAVYTERLYTSSNFVTNLGLTA